MSNKKLTQVLDAIDEINSQDTTLVISHGTKQPKELIYGHQMTKCLNKYWPQASELLQISIRAQHIKRWHLKRSEFMPGKAGYYQWRIAQGKFHAELTLSIMLEKGYTIEEGEQTAAIIRKEKLNTNLDSQTLEDVACLVFLEYYFEDFAAKHSEEKIIRIVQLTWKKMSDKAHNIALTLTLPEHLTALVAKALT